MKDLVNGTDWERLEPYCRFKSGQNTLLFSFHYFSPQFITEPSGSSRESSSQRKIFTISLIPAHGRLIPYSRQTLFSDSARFNLLLHVPALVLYSFFLRGAKCILVSVENPYLYACIIAWAANGYWGRISQAGKQHHMQRQAFSFPNLKISATGWCDFFVTAQYTTDADRAW